MRGYRLYKQKKYARALKYFRKTVEADDKYALAHYNLACVLAIMRSKGKICEYDAYQGSIMDHLEKSIELDPRRLKRAKVDPDLKSVHGTFRYQKLLGRDPTKPGDIKKILTAIAWYGPSPGAYGPVAGMKFLKEGRVEFWSLDAQSDTIKRVYHTGFYSVEGGKVIIQFGRAIQEGNATFLGTIRPDGVLEIPSMGTNFTDDPDECSA